MVHSRDDYNSSVEASQILFGKGTTEAFHKMDEKTFLSVFDGVPSFDINKNILSENTTFTRFCTEYTGIFSSKGELRRMVQGGGVSLKKKKIDDIDKIITDGMLLNRKYMVIQKGKKNYFLIKAN